MKEEVDIPFLEPDLPLPVVEFLETVELERELLPES